MSLLSLEILKYFLDIDKIEILKLKENPKKLINMDMGIK